MQNIILDQASAALIVSFLIEWMKNTTWFPYLQKESGNLNRLVAIVGSGVAAFGIHHSFDSTAGTLTITGLTLAGIYHGGWAWLRAFIVQEIAYQKLVRSNSSGGLQVQPTPDLVVKTS